MKPVIADFSEGTVFLNAIWSAPSQRALGALQDYWKSNRLKSSELHILNWDDYEQDLLSIPELANFVHGYGEAFHIREGKICGLTALGKSEGDLASAVRIFMEA